MIRLMSLLAVLPLLLSVPTPAAAEALCLERNNNALLCVEDYRLPNDQDCVRVYTTAPADPLVRACAGVDQSTHCVDLTHPGVPGVLLGACPYPTVDESACLNLYVTQEDKLYRLCFGPLDPSASCHVVTGPSPVSTGACFAAGPSGNNVCAVAYQMNVDQVVTQCVGPGSRAGCHALSVDVDAEACAYVREDSEGKKCPRAEADISDVRGQGGAPPRKVVEPVCVNV